MGMDQKVAYPPDRAVTWPDLAAFLAERNYPLQLRMIDRQLAFPDEQPDESWQELRVGTPAGMVTLRREADGLRLVTWGNADDALRRAWHALAWAVAHLSGGTVDGRSAAEFVAAVELPPELESGGR